MLIQEAQITQIYLVPQPVLFVYAARADMNPNDFMQKLRITHDCLNQKMGGYLLTRKQHAAMLYKAGIKKSEQLLTETEEEVLEKINTATLIEELERRTRG